MRFIAGICFLAWLILYGMLDRGGSVHILLVISIMAILLKAIQDAPYRDYGDHD